MKKYTILTFALVFGFLTTGTSTINALEQDDSLKQRMPVSIAELPREVTEAIQDEFEDYRITYAFRYSKVDAEGMEGTTQGTGRPERMGTERDKMREGMKEGAERVETGRKEMHEEMHEGAERMETKREEMRDTLQGAEMTGREGMKEGAERVETGRKEMHEEMHEGAERMEQYNGREGIPETQEEFLFTDEYDTYYEILLEGPDVKTVWYTEDGERIENETESKQRR